MAMWNPWRGCKKYSEGCLHCYIHKGDAKRGVNTNDIVKTIDFYKPIERLKNGNYKMKAGIVYLCFSTDFLIEEADVWRKECWDMIKERQDCTSRAAALSAVSKECNSHSVASRYSVVKLGWYSRERRY